MRFFATCPAGFGDLLEAELVSFGASIESRTVTGVGFEGELEAAYRACLWSRIANRVLLVLDAFAAADEDQLYRGVQRIEWSQHLSVDRTLAVGFTSARSQLSHSLYGAQRVKDAIVDQFRDASGSRPDVDTSAPDVRVNVHVERDRASVAIDLSGESLHRRGYRQDQGPAPLKENLAAGLLLRAGWREIAATGGALLDPMCGAGTFPIEALMIAADIAPGSLRESFGFSRWPGHNATLWTQLLTDAQERRRVGLARAPRIFGSDADVSAVHIARANVERAGFDAAIAIEQRALADLTAPAPSGLVIANPPYGKRLAGDADLPTLFATFGAVLRAHFVGWRASILAPDEELGFRTGLRLKKKNRAKNGPIDVVLLTFDVAAQASKAARRESEPTPLDPHADDFSNRVAKNLRRLESWARERDVSCFRIYDADLPDFAFAIDLYRGSERWLHAQEYAPPETIDAERAELRRRTVRALLPELADVPPANVFMKARRRQKGGEQYTRFAATDRYHEIVEHGCRLLVNFTDHLDTGLFLDHRPLRLRIQRESAGKRFLNLFAYTGTATVHALRGGAPSSVSVDLSNTYLDWARRNIALNTSDAEAHALVRADCRDWLVRATKRSERFDLILLDPPSFSKSKAARGVLNVQRDHRELIERALDVLAPGGTLYFSTNFQKFALDEEIAASTRVTDITRETIDLDFARSPKIHACWRIRG